jgi:hypothetical protein
MNPLPHHPARRVEHRQGGFVAGTFEGEQHGELRNADFGMRSSEFRERELRWQDG